jgi:hypothetical protein
MSSSLPNGISSLKFKVSTFEQDISSASLGGNSIKITEQNILNAIQSGVTINPSIVATYNNAAFSSGTGTGTGNVEVAGTPYVSPPVPVIVNSILDVKSVSGYSNRYRIYYTLHPDIDPSNVGILYASTASGFTDPISGSFITILEGSYSVDFIINTSDSVTRFLYIKLYNRDGTIKYAEIMYINVSGSV